MNTGSMHSPREQARAFAGRVVAGSVDERDREARWDRALFRRLGEEGLLAAVLPREFGGGGRPAADLVEAMLGFGEGSGDAGLALGWAAHTLGCGLPLARLGGAEQRRRHLPGLASGERVGSWAHAERPSAGDPVGVQTRAIRTADGWLIEGRKIGVVHAAHADVFVVSAVTEPARGRRGISTFLVERGAPGLFVAPRGEPAGPRTAAIGELVLDRCPVPEDSLLGPPGEGLRLTWGLVQRWERGCGAAAWLGASRAALARAAELARRRVRFGASLAGSQVVRGRLAELKIRVELCERLLARGARLLDADEPGGERELVSARLFLADSVAVIARELAGLDAPLAAEPEPALARLARDAPFCGLLGVDVDVLRSILAGAVLGLG